MIFGFTGRPASSSYLTSCSEGALGQQHHVACTRISSPEPDIKITVSASTERSKMCIRRPSLNPRSIHEHGRAWVELSIRLGRSTSQTCSDSEAVTDSFLSNSIDGGVIRAVSTMTFPSREKPVHKWGRSPCLAWHGHSVGEGKLPFTTSSLVALALLYLYP